MPICRNGFTPAANATSLLYTLPRPAITRWFSSVTPTSASGLRPAYSRIAVTPASVEYASLRMSRPSFGTCEYRASVRSVWKAATGTFTASATKSATLIAQRTDVRGTRQRSPVL